MKKVLLSVLLLVSVSLLFAQNPIRDHTDLKNWLPDQLMGLQAEGDGYSSQQQQGESYFIAAKKYKDSGSEVSVVIIDYRSKSKSMTDHLAQWKEGKSVETDLISASATLLGNVKAKEVFEKNKNSSQLYLYHKDRYLITLSTTQDNMQLLRNVAANLQLSTLPE